MADLNTKHISYEDLSTILLAQMTDNAKELAAICKGNEGTLELKTYIH